MKVFLVKKNTILTIIDPAKFSRKIKKNNHQIAITIRHLIVKIINNNNNYKKINSNN